MATTTLFPTSETDVSGNIQSGSFTDIANGVDTPSGTPLIGNNNSWINQVDNTQGGEIVFGLTDAPGDFDSFTSIQLRVRALVSGGIDGGDTMEWRVEIEGTNAPTDATSASWSETDDGAGYTTLGFTDSAVTPSAADITGWTVHIYQWLYNQDMGPDGGQWEIDEIELVLIYDVAVGGGADELDFERGTSRGVARGVIRGAG